MLLALANWARQQEWKVWLLHAKVNCMIAQSDCPDIAALFHRLATPRNTLQEEENGRLGSTCTHSSKMVR